MANSATLWDSKGGIVMRFYIPTCLAPRKIDELTNHSTWLVSGRCKRPAKMDRLEVRGRCEGHNYHTNKVALARDNIEVRIGGFIGATEYGVRSTEVQPRSMSHRRNALGSLNNAYPYRYPYSCKSRGRHWRNPESGNEAWHTANRGSQNCIA
jgi:hypothetical protein